MLRGIEAKEPAGEVAHLRADRAEAVAQKPVGIAKALGVEVLRVRYGVQS